MNQRKCKNYRTCGNTFIQYSTIDNLCHACKIKKLKNRKQPEKIKRSLNRKAGRTEEQKAQQRCDDLWSKIIKIKNPICWFAGCNMKSTQACHIQRRKEEATRWLVKNGMGGCAEHHRWETDHPKDAKPFVIEFIGAKLYEELRKKALKDVHYYLSDYLRIENNLKKTLKYLLKKSEN